MTFRSVFARLLERTPRPRVGGSPSSLTHAPSLEETLLRERSRADRTASVFCLVQFPGVAGQPRWRAFEKALRDRVRVTDVVGRGAGGAIWV
ncbi:MAG: hypothetical protein KY475_17370, partial [Planctomycetes bacterium]|nr:hypothetical protein [Planctomycetota bacterium]